MDSKPMLYAITDRTLVLGNHGGDWKAALYSQAEYLVREGVGWLQLREKDLSIAELAMVGKDLLEVLRGSGTKLLINGRPDVAIAIGAEGVHLTSSPDELRPSEIVKLYQQAGLLAPAVTVSCHTIREVERQSGEPLSAILFGPVFGKRAGGVTRVAGTGLDLLQQACKAAEPTAVLALGGLVPANIPECVAAGAAGVAGIRLFQRPCV